MLRVDPPPPGVPRPVRSLPRPIAPPEVVARDANRRVLLAMASPALMLLGLVGLVLRTGSARWQAVPALLIGVGLLVTSGLSRRRRRRDMLRDLRQQRASAARTAVDP